ncbi:MAG: hypothetical protein ACSHX8_01340 [Opitutaceae bacterium]
MNFFQILALVVFLYLGGCGFQNNRVTYYYKNIEATADLSFGRENFFVIFIGDKKTNESIRDDLVLRINDKEVFNLSDITPSVVEKTLNPIKSSGESQFIDSPVGAVYYSAGMMQFLFLESELIFFSLNTLNRASGGPELGSKTQEVSFQFPLNEEQVRVLLGDPIEIRESRFVL